MEAHLGGGDARMLRREVKRTIRVAARGKRFWEAVIRGARAFWRGNGESEDGGVRARRRGMVVEEKEEEEDGVGWFRIKLRAWEEECDVVDHVYRRRKNRGESHGCGCFSFWLEYAWCCLLYHKQHMPSTPSHSLLQVIFTLLFFFKCN